MQHNPYSAPQTSGSELRERPGRPASVKLAAILIVCSILVGSSKFFFITIQTSGVIIGIALALVFGVTALLVAAVLSRINWARWIVAVLLLANLAFFPFAIGHLSLSALKIVLLIQGFFQLTALELIFLPPSSKWYRPN